MPIPPPSPHQPTGQDFGQDIEHADRATLRDMLEGGMELAEEMARQVNRPNLGWEPADRVALAFDRLSRAVRRTVLFARRLDDGTDPARSQQDALFYRAVLQVLRDTGSAIRRGIAKQARTPAPFVPELPIADAGLALERVFRSQRRTMLLNRVLAAHPVPKRHRPRPAPPPARQPGPQPAPHPGADPAPPAEMLRIEAAHTQLPQGEPEEAEFEAEERLDTLPPLPDAQQIARLQAALDRRVLPRAPDPERDAIRERQSRRIEEWESRRPRPEPAPAAPPPPNSALAGPPRWPTWDPGQNPGPDTDGEPPPPR